MPQHRGVSPLLGLTNRVAHLEDISVELTRRLTTLAQRMDAQQQVGDADNLFLNCQECEKRIKKSAQVLEDYVSSTCLNLNAQKNAIYQEQQATRRSFAAQHSTLMEDLQATMAKCDQTIKHMRDTDRYCKSSLEAFHTLKDHLDKMAEHCDVPPHSTTLTQHDTAGHRDPKVEMLRAQVSKLRKKIALNDGQHVQEQLEHLRSLAQDLTGEVVAHESMLHDLHSDVHDYQDFRCMGRAISEARAEIIEEAKQRVTGNTHRSRSLSLDQRITGAQRVARLARGNAHADMPSSPDPRGRGR